MTEAEAFPEKNGGKQRAERFGGRVFSLANWKEGEKIWEILGDILSIFHDYLLEYWSGILQVYLYEIHWPGQWFLSMCV